MNETHRPKVLLADDHRIVAEGLRSLLEEEFDLAGIVEDGRAMVKAARELRPDVIVADISMPLLNGIDALAQLRQHDPFPGRSKRARLASSSSTPPAPSSCWRCVRRCKAVPSSLPISLRN